MPGPAGLEPIRRKAPAPLIEEQRTQDGRTLHSAPRVKPTMAGPARRRRPPEPPQDVIARPEPGPHAIPIALDLSIDWSRP
jgi:hypothetical protein